MRLELMAIQPETASSWSDAIWKDHESDRYLHVIHFRLQEKVRFAWVTKIRRHSSGRLSSDLKHETEQYQLKLEGPPSDLRKWHQLINDPIPYLVEAML